MRPWTVSQVRRTVRAADMNGTTSTGKLRGGGQFLFLAPSFFEKCSSHYDGSCPAFDNRAPPADFGAHLENEREFIWHLTTRWNEELHTEIGNCTELPEGSGWQ